MAIDAGKCRLEAYASAGGVIMLVILVVLVLVCGGTEAVYHAVMLDPRDGRGLHPAPDPEHGGRNAGSAKTVAATILTQESGVQEANSYGREKWWSRLDG